MEVADILGVPLGSAGAAKGRGSFKVTRLIVRGMLMVVADVLGRPLGSEEPDVGGGEGNSSGTGGSARAGCADAEIVPLDGHWGLGVGPRGAGVLLEIEGCIAGT